MLTYDSVYVWLGMSKDAIQRVLAAWVHDTVLNDLTGLVRRHKYCWARGEIL